MANTAVTQQLLAADVGFIARVKQALATVAWQVLNESDQTAGHTARATYARTVLGDLDLYARKTAGWLVARTNVTGATTSITVDENSGRIVVSTDAVDAALESQLSTDWSLIAGA
jgi:hypothetical protein